MQDLRELVRALRDGTPQEQEDLAAEIAALEVCEGVSGEDHLLYAWEAWARPVQLAPPKGVRWRFLFQRAGRGGGKTRSAAEMTRDASDDPDACGGSIALIAPTHGDIRITMVEGESGILAVCPPWNMPEWKPGYGHGGRLKWKNGVIALCFSADSPERLRGPQFGFAWGDEVGAWPNGMKVHDLLNFGLRLGPMPRVVYTSTPKPTPFVELLDRAARAEQAEVEAGTRDRRKRRYIQRIWSTFDNAENLPKDTVDALSERYGGTTQGEQELEAALLVDDPDALWSHAMIDDHLVSFADVPDLVRIAVAVDNATTVSKPGVIDTTTIEGRNRKIGSADTGIITAGLGVDGHYYIFRDSTMNAKPLAWGEQVIRDFADGWNGQRANVVVVEKNAGGDLIKANLLVVMEHMKVNRDLVPIRFVHASDAKEARADPIVSLYQQGKVHHVRRPSTHPGAIVPLSDLEYQLCRFKRGETGYKKDRVDAEVWALTELIESSMSSSSDAARDRELAARARAYVG